jgi:hypothetical protein
MSRIRRCGLECLPAEARSSRQPTTADRRPTTDDRRLTTDDRRPTTDD